MHQRAVLLNLPKNQTVDVEFTNVVYEIQLGFRGPKKQILKGASGTFKSGELTAIMGPSGAGKTTLLNLLTGFQRDKLQGKIEYVGKEGRYDSNDYRKNCCYIQQDDQLHPLFTVDEVMTMAADLKLSSSLNRKAKQMLIDDILDSLDLSKTKDTRCERLSGGQRKRLSIALELIDNPPVMFLDEPTTGLDSSSSLQCIAMLQSLARGGRTIICTIHQPSAAIYELFDNIYLLAEGRRMFEGAPKNTVAYFSSIGLQCPKYHNPADYMIEVVNKEYGNFNDQLAIVAADRERCWRSMSTEKAQTYASGIDRNGEQKTAVLITTPSEFSRFWVLLNRCFIRLYRDWMEIHLKLILHFLVAVLLGCLFFNAGADGSKSISNLGYLMVTVVYLCYTSMMPAVVRFPSELPVLKKERFNNWYQLRTYYAAFLVANLPIQMLFAFVYTSVSYFLSNQPMDFQRFTMFLFVTILTTFIAESFGLVLGSTVNPINGTFLGAISTCAMLIFAGFFVLFRHMPTFMYYVSYLSYLRYALDGLIQSIYGFNREKLVCPKHAMYCHYRLPETLLEDFSMNDGKYWIDVLILIMNFIFLRIIAYCTLKRKLSSA